MITVQLTSEEAAVLVKIAGMLPAEKPAREFHPRPLLETPNLKPAICNAEAARRLEVSESHLWRVIHGQRESRSLMRRYRKLLKLQRMKLQAPVLSACAGLRRDEAEACK